MLKKINEDLKTNDKPVTATFYDQSGTKIIAIGLGCGVEFKEHLTPFPVQLLVVMGMIDFNIENVNKHLECFDSYDIPVTLNTA